MMNLKVNSKVFSIFRAVFLSKVLT